MLKGVNDSQGNSYFQGKGAEVVCGITSMMSADKTIIEFFDRADFFTFAYESIHVFFEDICMLLREIKKRALPPFAPVVTTLAIKWEAMLFIESLYKIC